MIGLDTHVLVHSIVEDDPEQTARARAALATHCGPGAPAYVTHIVLCELVWVLRRSYGLSRLTVARILDHLTRQEAIVVEGSAMIRVAVEEYARTNVDFADVLIAFVHRAAGCSATLTFDRRAAARLPGFEAI